ncbi:MAG: phenylacetic acid degradation bifunctional protein PaaZ [Pseudomonadota bacterium]
MSLLDIHCFAKGNWVPPDSAARPIADAVTGDVFAQAGWRGIDAQGMIAFARDVGGPALRALGFHDRAKMLKALALHLSQHKDVLYDLSFRTGATQKDHLIDVDGGLATVFVFASKGRREMPDGKVYLDGPVETLSRGGTFLGQHIATPLPGVAVHINAFNFPIWGMLEKLAPTLLAGMPAIVKPATASCYVTERAVRLMLNSGILPNGALQLVTGGLGDMLDHLGPQDVVSFTGSAETALKLRSAPRLLSQATRFVAEQDSLNASILGPDGVPGSPEFDLFIKEAVTEITTKAGQKCTATRRLIVPVSCEGAVRDALAAKLARITIGNPREDVSMGALVSQAQRDDVRQKAEAIGADAEMLIGNPGDFELKDADWDRGAFFPPMLFHCTNPDDAETVHEVEAFGPVSTLMAYRDIDHAVRLANRGKGSLVASLFTHDGDVARDVTLGAGAFHGRLYINNRDSAAEATGHGAPLPHMVHGGPGRAGGGEELGGIRGVMHYMQRTAVQGSPDILRAVGEVHVPGATEQKGPQHPFRRGFDALSVGETHHTERREITLEDIEHFAAFTGDSFYAHMDDDAARRNPLFPGRVAHGYLILSFAAGLFVDPDEGPVLANTGLNDLRFLKPVAAGTGIQVALTVKRKTRRTDEYGEVRWHVRVTDDADDAVAEYELLTMNAY